MKDRVAVGARIRELRSSVGMTQGSLARRAKLTSKFLSQIETGRANPSIAVLQRVVERGLGVPLWAFFAPGDDLHRLAMRVTGESPRVRRLACRLVEVVCTETGST